jgi:hypothetical protein
MEAATVPPRDSDAQPAPRRQPAPRVALEPFTELLSVRASVEQCRGLEALARANRRSFSAEIRAAIDQHLSSTEEAA